MINNFTIYEMIQRLMNRVKFNSNNDNFISDLESDLDKLKKYIKDNKENK